MFKMFLLYKFCVTLFISLSNFSSRRAGPVMHVVRYHTKHNSFTQKVLNLLLQNVNNPIKNNSEKAIHCFVRRAKRYIVSI